jgi:endonuclease/exonuclease/phosphatase family metal-dependent hydrolase
MLKSELIKALEAIEGDPCVVIGDFNCTERGWCNIGTVYQSGSAISITEDFTRPFSSDN